MSSNDVAGGRVYHVHVLNILREFLVHNFVSDLRTLKSKNLKNKNLKPKKTIFQKPRFFLS